MSNENYSSSLVNLSIPKEVTNPIVSAKIQEAVLAALGGTDNIIKGVVNHICNTKVNKDGKVDTYNSNNSETWMDFHVTSILQKTIKEEIAKQLTVGAEQIKEELVKQLQTRKGASKVASALLDSFNGTFSSEWRSKIEVSFTPNKNY